MTPSPAYAARVPSNIDVQADALPLGILQGRGVRAADVTPAKVARARADYDRRLAAETARRVKAGIPLTGNVPEPGAAPVVSVRPPWE
jgi:hypothetical protein